MHSVATPYFGEVWLTRLLIQRGMAAIYLVAYLVALRQFRPLLGERGLLPVRAFLEKASFWQAPSLFQWRYSDRLADGVAWTGIAISGCALLGLTEAGPIWVSIGAWLALWALYLSIVNVGQSFYGFGWESMLLEAGFFTAFLGPASVPAPLIPVIVLRWMLFRTEVGAGLIKLRSDRCWRDLTCMFYHYETQPLPNPLSWYFHRLPRPLHRVSALVSHFVQVVVPFGLFAPQPAAEIAGGLIILHQLWLIVSGNYSWLNWLTVVLGFAAFSDGTLALVMRMHGPAAAARPLGFDVALYGLAAAAGLLSVRPALNLLSRRQVMNTSYNRFHLVNSYGAFGQVGRRRFEIVLEGTEDAAITPATVWREYGFRAKPGDPLRMPPQVAPWHLRLDWLIWFLSFSVALAEDGVRVAGYPIWFLRLLQRLLEGDSATLRLMRTNPFPGRPPAWIRARFYAYRYTTWREKRETGGWWSRRLLGEYLEPVTLRTLEKV
ncbi:MAG TPA: lipase maturation factor family protein [Acidobacteriaceae bacterium]